MQGSGDWRRKEGGRLDSERTLRVPPSCSFPVSHSGGPHVVSFVAVRRPCACGGRARASRARYGPRKACAQAGVARRAAKRKRGNAGQGRATDKKPKTRSAGQRRTKDKGLRQERELHACCKASGSHSGASRCLRSDLSYASHVLQGRGVW